MSNTKADRPTQKKSLAGKTTQKKSSFSLSQIKVFAGEVKNEFGKIAWPSRKHTIGSTVVVTILVMIIALYLGAVDLLLGKLIGLILK